MPQEAILSLPHSSAAIEEDQPPMTMQIGMVGTDGVILAGDTRCTRWPLIGGVGARHSYSASKIVLSEDGRIAVSVARDMAAGNRISEAIISSLANEEPQNRERRLVEIGGTEARGHDVECIVALAEPDPKLYFLQCTNSGQDVIGPRIGSFVHAGDTVNAATFWAMRYYKPLPVNQLARLAAHLVIVAGELNSATINGLEIVICGESGIRRLPEDEIRNLETDARRWDKEIGQLIFGKLV
jgi:20S proteasome alpha/beta subunit